MRAAKGTDVLPLVLILLLSFTAQAQYCPPPNYINYVGDKTLCMYPDGNVKWVYYMMWDDIPYDFIRTYPDTERACVSLYMDKTPGGCVPVNPETANFWVRVQMHAFGFVRVYGDCLFLSGSMYSGTTRLLFLNVYVGSLDKDFMYLVPDREDCCGGGPLRYIVNEDARMAIWEKFID